MLFPFHDDQPTSRPPIVTLGIIAINVAAFLFTLTLDEDQQNSLTAHYGFVPARISQLMGDPRPVEVLVDQVEVRPGVVQRRTAALESNRLAVALSLLTCMFLHGGIAHILGNMWFFWIFGNNIEDRLGHFVFLIFYLVGGLAATFCHAAMEPVSHVPVIGASGAVAAVLGGYAVTYPFSRVRSLLFLFYIVTVVELPAIAVLGIWFGGQLVSVLAEFGNQSIGGGIAFWAHIGGFLFGMAGMAVLTRVIPEITPTHESMDNEGQYYEPGPGGPYGSQGGGMWGGMPGRGRLGLFKPLGAPDPNGIQWLPGSNEEERKRL